MFSSSPTRQRACERGHEPWALRCRRQSTPTQGRHKVGIVKAWTGMDPAATEATPQMAPGTPDASRAKRLTVPALRSMKTRGERIAMVTAYDATFAQMIDEGG